MCPGQTLPRALDLGPREAECPANKLPFRWKGLRFLGKRLCLQPRPNPQNNTLPQFLFSEEGAWDQVIPSYRIFWSDYRIRVAGRRPTSLGLLWSHLRGW